MLGLLLTDEVDVESSPDATIPAAIKRRYITAAQDPQRNRGAIPTIALARSGAGGANAADVPTSKNSMRVTSTRCATCWPMTARLDLVARLEGSGPCSSVGNYFTNWQHEPDVALHARPSLRGPRRRQWCAIRRRHRISCCSTLLPTDSLRSASFLGLRLSRD